MSGAPVDSDPFAQLLPPLRVPSADKQSSDNSTSAEGGPQAPAQLQSPLSQPPSVPLQSPSPQLNLHSPGEVSAPHNINVKQEPPGTPNQGTAFTFIHEVTMVVKYCLGN